ncbi:MAG: metallophosphoesterase [Planctomycetota bacterium]
MMIDILKWTFAVVGHISVWLLLYNRIHATAWKRETRKRCEKVIIVLVTFPMVWVLYHMVNAGTIRFRLFYEVFSPAYWYGIVSVLMGCYYAIRWCWRLLTFRVPAAITSSATELLHLDREIEGPLLHGTIGKVLSHIPGNQATQLAIEHRSFTLPGCPPELDGLRISHLSDLHFIGQLDRRYFERVAYHSNAFHPDIVLITGDIVDSPNCLDWIESVLGKLISNHGVFYVLGNHDLRIKDESLLRRLIEEQGCVRAGGKWNTVEINGHRIHIAGNELPWFSGAQDLSLTPPGYEEGDFRLLMTHTPDQIDWARKYDFDLILAGHTHGGQIRIPVIGPLVAPSNYGIKYCGGTFQIGKSLMHVSRGLSGDESIRLNCPPELGCITIRSK